MALALNVVANKTGVFFLSVYQSDGVTPQDLTGTVLWFHAANSAIPFSINKSSSTTGVTINNIAGGLNCATLQIEPADTASLQPGIIYGMPCELTLQSGPEEYELAQGTFSVSPNVGTP